MRTEKMNPYYVGYNIMIESLKHEDVYEGLTNALNLAEVYLKSDNITIHELNDDGYKNIVNSEEENPNSKIVLDILNKSKKIDELEKPYTLELNEKNLQTLTIIPIVVKGKRYIISIENHNLNKNLLKEFEEILIDSFKVILDRISSYSEIKRISEEDSLTGLANRVAYSNKMEEKDADKDHITYAIIDLFRLKFVNDMIGHSAGDKYIQNVADILSKYFPKHENVVNEQGGLEKVLTGDTIYRIGGDEFVILSEEKNEKKVKKLIELAAQEVQELGFLEDEVFTIGINYGIAEREHFEDTEYLYQVADKRLSRDKAKMYQKLGIDRRK